MGARKLYEEKLLDLIKNMPEEEQAVVISMIEKIKLEKTPNNLQTIKEGRGKFKDILSTTDEFLKRKHEDKLLDL